MKICHVLWGLTTGGIETMLVNIANRQSALGHEVHLVVVNDMIDGPLRRMLAPAVRFHAMGRRRSSKNPLPLLRLNALLARERPDVTHFHQVNLPQYVAGPLRGRWCVTYHTEFLEPARAHLMKARNLIAISHEAARSIEEATGLHPVVVENGIEMARFKVRPVGAADATPFRIAQVGRLKTDVKGQHVLLGAVALLRDKGMDLRVDLIGDGPDRGKIAEMVAALGLEGIVSLVGPRTQEALGQEMAGYDLLVQPSLVEGFGLTVIEAMAAGVPVAAAGLPALREVTADGRLGALFAPGDEKECAAAIEEIIVNYPARAAMTPEARRHVGSRYSVERTALDYLRLYATL